MGQTYKAEFQIKLHICIIIYGLKMQKRKAFYYDKKWTKLGSKISEP